MHILRVGQLHIPQSPGLDVLEVDDTGVAEGRGPANFLQRRRFTWPGDLLDFQSGWGEKGRRHD